MTRHAAVVLPESGRILTINGSFFGYNYLNTQGFGVKDV
jgi:hypothetical protein